MRRFNIVTVRFQDEGIILRIIPFGETKRIITVFTKNHGVYQGMSDFNFSALTMVQCRWSSRTQGLGYWQLEEIIQPKRTEIDAKNIYLHQLIYQLLCDLLYHVLPPHHPYTLIFNNLSNYLNNHSTPDDFVVLLYLILHETGYGPNHVSPKNLNAAFQHVMELFEQHCQYHSAFVSLIAAKLSY